MTGNTDVTFQSYEITESQNYIQHNEPITTEATQYEDSDDES